MNKDIELQEVGRACMELFGNTIPPLELIRLVQLGNAVEEMPLHWSVWRSSNTWNVDTNETPNRQFWGDAPLEALRAAKEGK